MNVWTHAAVTYNGSVFRIYLNGVLDGTSAVINEPPRTDSAHRVGLGTAFDNAGQADGPSPERWTRCASGTSRARQARSQAP